MTDEIAWKKLGLEEDGVGITDVDCTPRPRYGEKPEAFQARIAGYQKEFDAIKAHNNKRNRVGALQPALYDAAGQAWYTTRCACKWHSVQAKDPELARREYDTHACSLVDADGGWQPGQTLHRKSEVPLVQTDWVAQTKALLNQGVAQPDDAPVVTTTEVDGTEQMMKLLELK